MRFTICLLLSIALPALGAPLASDADFLAVRDAFQAGDAAKLARIAPRLKNTQMEIYADYYQLRLGLENADIKEINDFLSRPEDTPMSTVSPSLSIL